MSEREEGGRKQHTEGGQVAANKTTSLQHAKTPTRTNVENEHVVEMVGTVVAAKDIYLVVQQICGVAHDRWWHLASRPLVTPCQSFCQAKGG